MAVALYFLGDFDAARRNAIRGVRVWRSEGVQSSVEEVDGPRRCLSRPSGAIRMAFPGEIDSSHRQHGRSDLPSERAERYARIDPPPLLGCRVS